MLKVFQSFVILFCLIRAYFIDQGFPIFTCFIQFICQPQIVILFGWIWAINSDHYLGRKTSSLNYYWRPPMDVSLETPRCLLETPTTWVSNKIMWVHNENRGSAMKIWGSPVEIWGSPVKIWESPVKIWGSPRESRVFQRKYEGFQGNYGVSTENLGVFNITPMKMISSQAPLKFRLLLNQENFYIFLYFT